MLPRLTEVLQLIREILHCIRKKDLNLNLIPSFCHFLDEEILYGGGRGRAPNSNQTNEPLESNSQNAEQNNFDNENIFSSTSLLHFRLTSSALNASVREYSASVGSDPEISIYFDLFSYTVILPSLIDFTRDMVRNVFHGGLRMFYDVNTIFSRPVDAENAETIYVPFRQRTSVFHSHDLNFIDASLSRSIDVLLEKISLFEEGGSSWSLESVLSIDLFIASMDGEMGHLGLRKEIIRLNLFATNQDYHLCNDGSLLLPTLIWSSCDAGNQCFCLALAAHEYSIDELKSVARMRGHEALRFKHRMLNRVFSLYNFSMVESFPLSFADIQVFERNNRDKLLLNVLGINLAKKQTGVRRQKVRVWSVLKSENLLQNEKQLPLITLVILRNCSLPTETESYHVGYVFSFQSLMERCAQKKTHGRVYCPACLSSIAEKHFDLHAAACGSASNEPVTVQLYGHLTEKKTFSYGKKASTITSYAAMDLECSLLNDEKSPPKLFGQMSQTVGRYVPVSFSFQSVLNVHDKSSYALLTKCYAGPKVMHSLFSQILLEMTYQHSVLMSLNYPLYVSAEQRCEASMATHCASCRMYIRPGGGVIHHLHDIPTHADGDERRGGGMRQLTRMKMSQEGSQMQLENIVINAIVCIGGTRYHTTFTFTTSSLRAPLSCNRC